MLKRNSVFMVLVLAALLFCCVPPRPAAAQPNASVTSAFSDLNDYGEWYKMPRVGWVWVPYADANWRPFVYGHWACTDEGWTWISDEPFGWIVCHYGNWYHDDELGWAWVPGYEYSPARVSWVVTDDEVGWAPLAPPGYTVPPAFGPLGSRHWVFVHSHEFLAPSIQENVVVEHPRPGPGILPPFRRRILGFTPPNITYVRKVTGAPVHTVAIERENQPVVGHRLVRVHVAGEAPVQRAVPVGAGFRFEHPKKVGVEVIRSPEKPRVIHAEAPARSSISVEGQRSEPVGVVKVHPREAEPEPGPQKAVQKESQPTRAQPAPVEPAKAPPAKGEEGQGQ